MSASPSKPVSSSPAVELIKALWPSLVALVSGAALNGTAAAEFPDRYQLGIDVVVVASMLGLVVSLVAAIYPFALERPIAGAWRRFVAIKEAKKLEGDFRAWSTIWAEMTALLYDATASEKKDGW